MCESDKAVQLVLEAAFDYKLACEDVEFALLSGGVDELKNKLFKAVANWEDALYNEIGC